MAKSTIVEIIMALQPGMAKERRDGYLRQQKLLWHYSHLLAGTIIRLSTIVEIIMALQPSVIFCVRLSDLRQQKLLWHYSRKRQQQEQNNIYDSRNYYGIIALQSHDATLQIYDSRNYYGIIARGCQGGTSRRSTIVEIIMALQPLSHGVERDRIYDSRNYYGIIACIEVLW